MTIDDLTDELVPYLRQRLTGRQIVGLGDTPDSLRLNDGTILTLYCSDQDCCATAEGKWILQPDALEAIITDVNVTLDTKRSGYDGDGNTNYATITILHNQNPVALADCYANDGNGGYYFSILSLRVTNIIDNSGRHDLIFRVVDSSQEPEQTT